MQPGHAGVAVAQHQHVAAVGDDDADGANRHLNVIWNDADPLSGTTDWTTRETPFFLQKGENPDNVRMNLVINGKGTVWIDDIRLLMAPLDR